VSCGVVHPELNAPCILGAGVHKSHVCRPESGGVVQWANTAYVEVPPKKKWTPKPPSKFTNAEMKAMQEEASRIASQESGKLNARTDDPPTSKQAAHSISVSVGAKKRILLELFYEAGEEGMADFEAAERADGIANDESGGWWKRCSDLRRDGLIRPFGDVTKTNPHTGMQVMISVITDDGRDMVARSRD
jgi:hypothetical protein